MASRNGWVSQLSVNYLSLVDTPEDAHSAGGVQALRDLLALYADADGVIVAVEQLH